VITERGEPAAEMLGHHLPLLQHADLVAVSAAPQCDCRPWLPREGLARSNRPQDIVHSCLGAVGVLWPEDYALAYGGGRHGRLHVPRIQPVENVITCSSGDNERRTRRLRARLGNRRGLFDRRHGRSQLDCKGKLGSSVGFPPPFACITLPPRQKVPSDGGK
jgi:hypothetical protein